MWPWVKRLLVLAGLILPTAEIENNNDVRVDTAPRTEIRVPDGPARIVVTRHETTIDLIN